MVYYLYDKERGDDMEKVFIKMPIKGKVTPLSEVNDYLFNKKMMGEGVAIIPEDDFVYAPVSGEIVVLSETKHAIAIETAEGLKVLLHLGIDTVKLEGKGFATYIKLNEKVCVGDKIAFFDRAYLDKKASVITPIVITNPDTLSDIKFDFKASAVGDTLMEVNLK